MAGTGPLNSFGTVTITDPVLQIRGDMRSLSFSDISGTLVDTTHLLLSDKTYFMAQTSGGSIDIELMIDSSQGAPVLPASGGAPMLLTLRIGNDNIPSANGPKTLWMRCYAHIQKVRVLSEVNDVVRATMTLRPVGEIERQINYFTSIPPFLPPNPL